MSVTFFIYFMIYLPPSDVFAVVTSTSYASPSPLIPQPPPHPQRHPTATPTYEKKQPDGEESRTLPEEHGVVQIAFDDNPVAVVHSP